MYMFGSSNNQCQPEPEPESFEDSEVKDSLIKSLEDIREENLALKRNIEEIKSKSMINVESKSNDMVIKSHQSNAISTNDAELPNLVNMTYQLCTLFGNSMKEYMGQQTMIISNEIKEVSNSVKDSESSVKSSIKESEEIMLSKLEKNHNELDEKLLKFMKKTEEDKKIHDKEMIDEIKKVISSENKHKTTINKISEVECKSTNHKKKKKMCINGIHCYNPDCKYHHPKQWSKEFAEFKKKNQQTKV